MGSSLVMTDVGNTDAIIANADQPGWRTLLLVCAVACLVIPGILNLPMPIGLPLVLFGMGCSLVGLTYWLRTLTLLVPHLLTIVVLLAATAIHAYAWGQVANIILLHGLVVAGIFAIAWLARQHVTWAYLLPTLPIGLAIASVWDLLLRHQWSGPGFAVAALMLVQAVGVGNALTAIPLRMLVISMIITCFLIGNQRHWMQEQVQLLHLRRAQLDLDKGAILDSPFRGIDVCRWGQASAPLQLLWVVNLQDGEERTRAQAAAFLTQEQAITSGSLAITMLMQTTTDPAEVGAWDTVLLTLPHDRWMRVLAGQNHGNVGGNFLLQALTVLKGSSDLDDPVLTCLRLAQERSALRQAVRTATAEAGLPSSSFLRILRSDRIISQGIDVLDATHLANLLSPSGASK